jgi:hypothetical protein
MNIEDHVRFAGLTMPIIRTTAAATAAALSTLSTLSTTAATPATTAFD